MHYRKKTPRDEAKEKEKLAKAQKFHLALTKFLDLKKSGNKDRALLKDLANLLRISPEFTTLWNYRKEIFIDFKQFIEASEKDTEKLWTEFDKLCQNELDFIQTCLLSNPKSYSTWHHRVWLIQFMRNPDLKKEIQLCDQCLSLDERNFHCWNYRRFIVKFGNITTMEELQFTSKKICDNFSNFSSWYYRSSLLKQLLEENYDRTELNSIIDQDFITVKNAIFTDPNDQSPWLYLRWLLKFEKSLKSTGQESETDQSYSERIADLVSLLDIETNSKWTNYMLTMLGAGDCLEANIDSLIKMDPLRTNYYNDLRRKTILNKKLSK